MTEVVENMSTRAHAVETKQASGTAESESEGGWKYRIGYLPIFLFVIVALSQIYLAHTSNLCAWKGGGFGMFSTTDGGSNRHLHIFLLNDTMHKEVVTPDPLIDLDKRTANLPTERKLRKFGRKIAEAYSDEMVNFSRVRVEVWRTEFDAETLQPKASVIRELTIEWKNETSQSD